MKCLGEFGLFVWIKMAVNIERRFYLFMTKPFGNQQWGKIQLNQQRGMGMTQVVEPYPRDAGVFAASIHLMVQVVLCIRKKAILRLKLSLSDISL